MRFSIALILLFTVPLLGHVGCGSEETNTPPRAVIVDDEAINTSTVAPTSVDLNETRANVLAVRDTRYIYPEPEPLPLQKPTPLGANYPDGWLLSRQTVAITDGYSTPVTFSVPSMVDAVMVTVLGQGDTYYALSGWDLGLDRNGNGDPVVLVEDGWVDDSVLAFCLSCRNRIAPALGNFTALAPNNPSVSAVTGEHAMTIYAFQGDLWTNGDITVPETEVVPSDEVIVEVLGRAWPAISTDYVEIDLNIFLTGSQGTDTANAEDNELLQAAVAELTSLFAPLEIGIGALRYADIGDQFATIESVIGANSDLSDMFAAAVEHSPSTGINVFLVDKLYLGPEFGPFARILGISSGSPGTPMVGGPTPSGVAVAIAPFSGNRSTTGRLLAHELGHFLGLFHTSEAVTGQLGAAIHDQLPETAEQDDDELMHYTAVGARMRPSQGAVMRGHLEVRATATSNLE